MNLYKYSSWKNNCAAHESWDDIKECKDMSASMTIEEALLKLAGLLNVMDVEINMRNNKFIDKIISDYPEKEFEIMIPESKLDNYINKSAELRKLSYRTLFHKSFYENIDKSFPYQHLTLQQIGIPPFDVIQVSTDKGLFYVELSGDSAIYI